MTALEGIKVLDLTRYLPGPYCAQMLADYGAQVLKVEEMSGDPSRSLYGSSKDSSSFFAVNRNKQSICLNLKTEEGKEVLKKLAAEYDVLIEQFRPGVLDKLGVGYSVLQAINPRLIYCAITGYGQTGPLRDAAGHDLNYLAISGLLETTGAQNGPPVLSGAQLGDIAGGTLQAFSAILLALLYREHSGKGQFCDIAMTDGASSLLAYALTSIEQGKTPARGTYPLSGGFACYQVYAANDNRYISLGAIEEKFWRSFCQRLDLPETYLRDQWNPAKQSEMIHTIQQIFQQKSRDQWVTYFSDLDICLAPILDMAEAALHPQNQERGNILIQENFQDRGEDLYFVGAPIKLSQSPAEVKFTFATRGQHTDEVLQLLGYTDEVITQWKQKGIVG